MERLEDHRKNLGFFTLRKMESLQGFALSHDITYM